MQIGNYDHGNLHLIPIKRTLPHDTNMEFDLSSLPSTINGMPAAVVTFLVGTPTGTEWDVPQAKFGDGLSAAQLLGTSVRLSMSPMCPYEAFDGGDVNIAGVDGPRALQMLAFSSGMPTIYGADTFNAAAPGGAGETTVYSLAASISAQLLGAQLAGPMQKKFPIGQGAVGGVGTMSDQVWFSLPVGVLARGNEFEDISDTAIPNTMYNGQGFGEDGQKIDGSSGKLNWSPGLKVDNATVTYGENWSMWALCMTHSPSKQPSPLPIHIRQLGGSGDSTWNARAGIREYLGFMRKLTTAGAMEVDRYQTVNCKVDGKLMNEPTVAMNRIGQNFMRVRDAWKPTDAQNALANRAATRFSRWGVDLLFRDGSLLRAPGSVNHLTTVDIVDTDETTHFLIDCTRTPVTDKVKRRAIAWNARPGAARVIGTRNGNRIDPSVEDIFGPLLPGKIVSPLNGSAAVSGPMNQAATVEPKSGSASEPLNKKGG